jgi:hypothetical protein
MRRLDNLEQGMAASFDKLRGCEEMSFGGMVDAGGDIMVLE